MNEKIVIKIILGSTRKNRFSLMAGQWIREITEKFPLISSEIVDLREYEMPFFDAPISPSSKKEPYPHEAVARFTDIIEEGDAYIFIVPEYNHSIPAVLKNALDWVYAEWAHKPAAFISYGSVSGARAVEHMRQIVGALSMVPLQNAVQILSANFIPVRDSNASPLEMFSKYEARAFRLIDSLAHYAQALQSVRKDLRQIKS